ncbi:hypothetical protein GFS24_10195 [Chitinophaga sp. SYP-B3965]|uniref:hypothetical protein n=1 Tax=Chitinophaga sp. SYP-B3965 TaxID=2663120 RepID=UPI001299CABB|nr:hypothetical protein [Chitinophaga sp. SYP-B3965]MRG45487.1 hypothetical protein [Chitinophaga sp. SYP-B3965]
MPTKEVIVTRKIQLLINSDDAEIRSETWKTLRSWRFICFKAANFIFSHHFLQEQLKELIYLTDDVKIKLTDIKKDSDGILTTSKMNTTYQILSNKFKGELPMNILGALNNILVTQYNSERQAYQNGDRSVRNYKRTIPIPIPARNITRIKLHESGKYYSFNLFGLSFNTYFGKDYDDKRVMWERWLSGEYQLCTSSLKFDQGKIFLLAVFKFDKFYNLLNSGTVAEASLSIEIPIVVKINGHRYEIGTKEDYLHRRIAIQQSRIRAQKSIKYNRSKNGLKRQKQNLLSYAKKEVNYVETKLHLYSKMLIDLCVKNGAGTLILIEQKEKEEEAKQDTFLLRNWSYFKLKDKIQYKSDRVGIKIICE